MRHRVAIVGGGFGGLSTARRLRSAPVDTLLDRRNHHLFQPLLYQVATGMLSPANIAAPLRVLVKNQADTTILLSEVVDIDVDARELALEKGRLTYDTTGPPHDRSPDLADARLISRRSHIGNATANPGQDR
jgi:NADH:ubiquinone reductase (H+-translocating)